MNKTGIDELLKASSHSIVDVLDSSPADDRKLQHLYRTATELCHTQPGHQSRPHWRPRCRQIPQFERLVRLRRALAEQNQYSCVYISIIQYVHYSGEFESLAEIKSLSATKREPLLKERARSFFHYQHADDDSDDDETPQKNC